MTTEFRSTMQDDERQNPSAIPIERQRKFWDEWNASTWEQGIDEISRRQGAVVGHWLASLGRRELDIVEVGCGAGWLCPQLLPFGRVTATDLAADVIGRAQVRLPQVRFVAGDFMNLDLGEAAFDVVISLEVLSHVADQPAFIARLRRLLRQVGHLMLATQNRPVLERFNRLPPPGPGQLRRWVDAQELRDLLSPHFQVLELMSVTPLANRGVMRLVNSRKLNQPLRWVVGDRLERLKESWGLGWTLMALARRL